MAYTPPVGNAVIFNGSGLAYTPPYAGAIEFVIPPLIDFLPAADISTGSWAPSTGTLLYPTIDETTADFSDYIYSPPDPTTETFEVKLATLDDSGFNTNHSVEIGLKAMNFDTVFDFKLVQGTTILDSWTEAVGTAEGDVIRVHNFSEGVIASITDRTDLRIRGVAHA